MKKLNVYLPLLFAITMALGMLIGSQYHPNKKSGSKNSDGLSKIKDVLLHIESSYVDEVDEDELTQDVITEILSNLDPHSYYIPKKEFVHTRQTLQGGFEGIGVEFNILNDTLVVVSAIPGGPSESLGIRSGDKIIEIEGEVVAGVGLSNQEVRDKLLGEKGTKVKIKIKRNGQKELIEYTITRDKIPIYSVVASYMFDEETGYIKVNNFSSKTGAEFSKAINELKSQGLKNLILDLGGNPGGYLDAARDVLDNFFDRGTLVVYTKGRARELQEYYTKRSAKLDNGKLVVLIDEGSASASEIVAGAIQDWDRGAIIGRRSFGKGLVQEQITLNDNSALRLTVARYYTPIGRNIQKPFSITKMEDYYHEIYDRYESGELYNRDSIKYPDSLKFKTKNGRIVYGGGGIVPDIFVPLDTIGTSGYLNQLYKNGIINQFVLYYADKNREKLTSRYLNFEDFRNDFNALSVLPQIIEYAEKQGVERNDEQIEISKVRIVNTFKAFLAKQLFDEDAFYYILNEENADFKKALEIINSDKYEKLGLINQQ
jgi:carboxyl-terminal processing protease